MDFRTPVTSFGLGKCCNTGRTLFLLGATTEPTFRLPTAPSQRPFMSGPSPEKRGSRVAAAGAGRGEGRPRPQGVM